MIEIYNEFDQELFIKASRFSDFRLDCKEYLRNKGREYDKFTIVEHDSSVGYISEQLICKYLRTNYPNVKVKTWEDKYDIKKIIEIVNSNSDLEHDINYVSEYFYDRYDLELKLSTSEYFIDVKSALTKKTPSNKWTFLYPVVQAHKEGKSGMILAYCVVSDIHNIESLNSFVLVGFISQEKVKNCKKYLKGDVTKFNTVNQIDNYETLLSQDYLDIEEFLHQND